MDTNRCRKMFTNWVLLPLVLCPVFNSAISLLGGSIEWWNN
jgi:hypothetical protein